MLFEPDLKLEVTLAIFQISGKMPLLKDTLNIISSGLDKISAASLTSLTDILSFSADLEHFKFFISLSIVLGWMV